MPKSPVFWIVLAGALIGAGIVGALANRPQFVTEVWLPYNCYPDCPVNVEVLSTRLPYAMPEEVNFQKTLEHDGVEYSITVWIQANNLHLSTEDTHCGPGPWGSKATKYNVLGTDFIVRFKTPNGVEEYPIRLGRYINYAGETSFSVCE